jgi:hypothetical protein
VIRKPRFRLPISRTCRNLKFIPAVQKAQPMLAKLDLDEGSLRVGSVHDCFSGVFLSSFTVKAFNGGL